MSAPDFGRRDALAALIAAVTAGSVPMRALAAVVEPGLPARTRAALDAVVDTIVPATETPGALAAGVPGYMLKFVARAGGAAGVDAFASTCETLRAHLDRLAPAGFAAASPARREELLARVDAEAMAGRTDCRPGIGPAPAPGSVAEAYLLVRTLAVWAYFTSEVGGGTHLRFELVPGHYAPDVPLGSDWVNYSNETMLGQ